jgi:uncharacterized membrane protein|tara:strand:- start:34 stop:231 length:198 start_codon:yes stop_codon:yes gene_type:complete
MKVSYKATLIKTIIWRILATILTFLSAWLVTGNVKVGLAIGGVEALVKMIGYFTFERLWNKLNIY